MPRICKEQVIDALSTMGRSERPCCLNFDDGASIQQEVYEVTFGKGAVGDLHLNLSHR